MAEQFDGPRYTMIAWQRRQEILYYHEFGWYQGEWVMLAVDPRNSNYFIYKDYYGSCSGCDAYEAEFSYKRQPERDSKEVKAFVEKYPPFLTVEQSTMGETVRLDELLKLLPANIRTEGDIDIQQAARDMTTAVKIREEIEIDWTDVLDTTNAEIASSALRELSYERFLEQAQPELIHEEGEYQLFKLPPMSQQRRTGRETGLRAQNTSSRDQNEPLAYVSVLDSSTDRRYLLRVPPSMTTCREAVAWTFYYNDPQEYAPEIEA